jgi:uncharacterized membrane protein YfcA
MEPVLMFALFAVGVCAGALGTLFGLGGGIIFIPVLTILFGLTASEAVAVSLVGIIAASTGATSYYVKNGYANIRLGLLLEVTTCIGAMAGAFLAVYVENWALLVVFGCVLIYGAVTMVIKKEKIIEDSDENGMMDFTYTAGGAEPRRYKVVNVNSGLAVCAGAGLLASLTGVGGGTIKVPLMNIRMHVPIKVATATSSYMIGITAFSGAIIFFINGNLLLDHATAIAVGAFLGSMIGTRLTKKIDAGPMRRYFSILLIAISITIFLRAGGVL